MSFGEAVKSGRTFYIHDWTTQLLEALPTLISRNPVSADDIITIFGEYGFAPI
jgi:hypothetical protein